MDGTISSISDYMMKKYLVQFYHYEIVKKNMLDDVRIAYTFCSLYVYLAYSYVL